MQPEDKKSLWLAARLDNLGKASQSQGFRIAVLTWGILTYHSFILDLP